VVSPTDSWNDLRLRVPKTKQKKKFFFPGLVVFGQRVFVQCHFIFGQSLAHIDICANKTEHIVYEVRRKPVTCRMMKVVEVLDGRAAFGYDALLDRQKPDLAVQLWQQRQ
jgi:hypothetical protein